MVALETRLDLKKNAIVAKDVFFIFIYYMCLEI